MPRIPNIQKFRGDNSQSFLNWIRQFEAQLAANGIEDDRKRDILLCCCDEAVFMTLSSEIENDNGFTYPDPDAKDLLQRTYTGTNYKRTLESKLRLLRFLKGIKIYQFFSALYTVIRELYDIHDENAIQFIAISHVVSNLDGCPGARRTPSRKIPPRQIPQRKLSRVKFPPVNFPEEHSSEENSPVSFSQIIFVE